MEVDSEKYNSRGKILDLKKKIVLYSEEKGFIQ